MKRIYRFVARLTGRQVWEIHFIWTGYVVANPDKARFQLLIEFLIVAINHPARMHREYLEAVRIIEDAHYSMATVVAGFRGLARNMEYAQESFDELAQQLADRECYE